MKKFDLSFGVSVHSNGAPFVSAPPVTYHGFPEPAVAKTLGLSASIVTEIEKAKDKGGDIQIALVCVCVPLDGGTPPPGTNLVKLYSGLTRHGLSDVQFAQADIAKELAKLGRERATEKEGKHK